MAFYVGQRVVCVDDRKANIPGSCWGDETIYPVEGRIYTVSAVGLIHPRDSNKLPCLLVEELKRNESAPVWAHRFRPIVERKTDISVFHGILRKTTRRQGADV